jgi:gluconokinase
VDCVVALDIGSSSARTLLFDFTGKQVDGFGEQVPYRAHTTADGGWEIDPAHLTEIASEALSTICSQMHAAKIRPAAVAVDTFWHSIMGVDGSGAPTTAILHPFDNRSAAVARELAKRVDNKAQHARTGCVIHPSYPPARLLWLARDQPEAVARTRRWMSAGEFLFLKLLGGAATSTSMVSAGGLWDQNKGTYDEELLAALPVKREQFAPVESLDAPVTGQGDWPELNGIPWYPALGDGACDNIGSGCAAKDRFALMVGTSGAMRAVTEADHIEIPEGLFCYRVDRKRFVLGGALSNGGEVFAWMKRNLRVPDDNDSIATQLAALKPFQHGLTMLPLFAGERSTGWRADARGAIIGLSSSTTPIDILQASFEAVALTFRSVYELMVNALGAPAAVVGSGAAMVRALVWVHMVADALPHSIVQCLEPEATARGAAILALERLGVPTPPAPRYGDTIQPAENAGIYAKAAAAQRALYTRLFEETR